MTFEKLPGDERFVRAFTEHEESLRAYARSMVPNWETVDEILQEGSLVMWQKFDQLIDEEGFLPWAKAIVRFEALKARRTAARDKLWFSEDVINLISHEDTDTPQLLDRERAALDTCLNKLSKTQRDLVLLPYRDHGAITRFAEETKKSANSCYKKIGRIRDKLTSCIRSELNGEVM